MSAVLEDASGYATGGRRGQAREVLSDSLAAYGPDARILRALAVLEYEAGHGEAAVADTQEAAAMDPTDAVAIAMEADLFRRMRHFRDTLELFANMDVKLLDHPAIRDSLGRVYYDLNWDATADDILGKHEFVMPTWVWGRSWISQRLNGIFNRGRDSKSRFADDIERRHWQEWTGNLPLIDNLGIDGFPAAAIRAELDDFNLGLAHNQRITDEAATAVPIRAKYRSAFGTWVVVTVFLLMTTWWSWSGLLAAFSAMIALALGDIIFPVRSGAEPAVAIEKDMVFRRPASVHLEMRWVWRGALCFAVGAPVAVWSWGWGTWPVDAIGFAEGVGIVAAIVVGFFKTRAVAKVRSDTCYRLDRLFARLPRAALLDALLDLIAEVPDEDNQRSMKMRAHWIGTLERAATVLDSYLPQFFYRDAAAINAAASVQIVAQEYMPAAVAVRNLKREVAASRHGSWDRMLQLARHDAEAVARGELGLLVKSDSHVKSPDTELAADTSWWRPALIGATTVVLTFGLSIAAWVSSAPKTTSSLIIAGALAVLLVVFSLFPRESEKKTAPLDCQNPLK